MTTWMLFLAGIALGAALALLLGFALAWDWRADDEP